MKLRFKVGNADISKLFPYFLHIFNKLAWSR